MGILQSILGLFFSKLADRIVSEVGKRFDIYLEKKHGVEQVRGEAKTLVEEWENAKGESEREAIIRKFSQFADMSRITLK